ncbi:hypothetical protein ACRALDRAFT_2026664 [Sodiomyces alcalophilus JCM 7366]|uniref:uncharacterized protein n=1 Tax=Sodiomyces alcalophilus JCM 7366 TaxID=591952 RepID=UPI0039B5CCA5
MSTANGDILRTDVTPEGFLAATVVFVVTAVSFVVVRIVNSMRYHKKLLIDDFLFLAATGAIYNVQFTRQSVSNYVDGGKKETDKSRRTQPAWNNNRLHRTGAYHFQCLLIHPAFSVQLQICPPTHPLQTIVASMWTAVLGNWTAKAPILILFIRIFGVTHWLRRTCYVTLVLLFLLMVASGIWGSVLCSPEGRRVDLAAMENCINRSLVVGVYNGVISLVVDIEIFLLPLPVLARLHLPTGQKIGVFAVFFTGLFAIIGAAISLYYRGTSLAGVETNQVGQMLGQVVENAVTIMVGCAPSIRSFWQAHVPDGKFYSAISAVFSTRQNQTQSSLASQQGFRPSNTKGPSSESVSAVQSREHLELGQIPQGSPVETHATYGWTDGDRRGWAN